MLWRQVDWVPAILGWSPIISEDLSILGQGDVGQGAGVMHQGSGRGVQVASGTSSLSMRVVERCMAWLFASIRWVGCRWWEGCQQLDEPFVPVIWHIGCGRAARKSVCCRVVFRSRVRHCSAAAQGMMLI